jgi:phenylacetate-CoA ligase
MSAGYLRAYVDRINRFRPVSMWAYVDSAYQLARFVREERLAIHPIPSTVVTAGTLTEEIRAAIEESLGTRVYNQYGSREVGPIAAECPHQEGLHLFEWSQLVEVVDAEGHPVAEGQVGEVVITLLSNYSMPLIRYRIGDTAVATQRKCSCGRPTGLLASVTGRVTDYFVRADGTLVHGEYFTHLFYHRGWVRRFQTVQEDHRHVVHHLEVERPPGEGEERVLRELTQAVMGPDCRVEFVYPEKILPSSSGKYLYTYSKVGRG